MKTSKTLFGVLMTSLVALAGTAAAIGGDVAGYATVEAYAGAHVDASGTLEAVEDLQAEIKTEIEARQNETRARFNETHDSAVEARTSVQAKYEQSIRAGQNSRAEAEGQAHEDVEGNVDIVASWFTSLWVKPRVDLQHSTDLTTVGEIVANLTSMDGSIEAHAYERVGSDTGVDYNIPPPPTPKLGLLASLQVSLTALLSLAA